ncbi:MAG: hypothetical protein FJW39_25475 [Acidobacteria bacterium]|nr:hypothetical protein [Acidobacteriota bacterium]
MASLDIALPQNMLNFVEGQVDQRRRAAERLEGLNSGEPIEVTPEYWERLREDFIERNSAKPSMR